jgi:hypothetical protein
VQHTGPAFSAGASVPVALDFALAGGMTVGHFGGL